MANMAEVAAALATELTEQAGRCSRQSPLYAELLTQLAEDAAAGGLTAELLAPYAEHPEATVPGLRLMAAIHQLVLQQKLPKLAEFYPSMGGTRSPPEAWPLFNSAMHAHVDDIRQLLTQPVQTNEPGRAAVLFGALLVISDRTGLSIRLREIGASAGLNLRVDHFCYRTQGKELGDPNSPVVLADPWQGTPPAPLDTAIRIVDRRGCDLAPIDPFTDAGQLRLAALVWADPARLARLRAAIRVAKTIPAYVDKASAVEWVGKQLTPQVPGTVTVIWHSVMRQYVPPIQWRQVEQQLAIAGEFATSDTPIAEVSFEPEFTPADKGGFPVRLTLWPGGQVETLATARPHGTPVHWRDGSG